MPLDLKSLATGQNDPLIEPRDIFAGLGSRPWPRLRVGQDEVLKAWFDRKDERDLVIKQNTGGGKTVVGLLIGQSSINEGVGPVAYLVPDTYLVQQVVKEADDLGIAVTIDHKGSEFFSSQAILVTTFPKVVNGRTSFGLSDSAWARHLGTVIVDDAHAALAAARQQFTVDVPPQHPAFDKALSVFGGALKRQSYKHATALVNGDQCAPLRIPFWTWREKHREVTDLIRASAADDTWKTIFFSWPLIEDDLDLTVATISHRGLQLRTPCPSIARIPAFHQAKRRVYLTATLADDGILVTDLAAAAASVRTPITPERATDLGDRLILAPGALNPKIIDITIRELVEQFAQGDRDGDGVIDADSVNVAVLVPSDAAAAAWAAYAQHTLHVHDMKPVIDRMTSGEHVGLVVLVNKYDGVDLPHGACRLLVVDGVPTPLDPGEQREVAALAGSDSLRIRRIQRLEQGMGRGIRDAEDHCAVLLLGNDLALSLVDPANLRLFSPATRAQIALSQEVAQQIAGEGLVPVRETLSVFLERDEGWKAAASRAIAGVVYDSDGHVSPVAEARRLAWDRASSGDERGAAEALNTALAGVDDIERGWRQEEIAAYQHPVDPERAQQTILSAKRLNSNALMPEVAIAARPVRGRAQQAVDVTDYLSRTYTNGTELQLAVRSMLDDLTYDPARERVDAAEAGFKQLGLTLGFDSTRPEKEDSSGPDGCWGMTPTKNAVLELKTGTSRPNEDITKGEADQLAGAVSWNADTNKSEQCVPVLIARSARLDRVATLPPGTRVITPDDLDALKAAVSDFATDIAASDGWTRTEVVSAALVRHHLTVDEVLTRYSSPPERPTP